MKKCPYCAEEIQDEAVVCRFCGRDIATLPPPAVSIAPTTAKRTSKVPLIAGILVVALWVMFCLGFCTLGRRGSGSSTTVYPNSGSSSGHDVTYEVTGTASGASLTYSNADGGTEQGDYKIPFRKTFRMDYGDFVYISAQNLGEYGAVTCAILVDGASYKESTSSGAYKIATCSGSIGGD